MTGTSGGHYEHPTIQCSECGRIGGMFSKVRSEWLCDECVEFEDMISGDFIFPKLNGPREPFNMPKFIWGRPDGKR